MDSERSGQTLAFGILMNFTSEYNLPSVQPMAQPELLKDPFGLTDLGNHHLLQDYSSYQRVPWS